MSAELGKQCTSILQVAGFKPFSKPLIYFCQHSATLATTVLLLEQIRKTGCGAKLPRFRSGSLSDFDSSAESGFNLARGGRIDAQERNPLEPVKLGFVDALTTIGDKLGN